MYVSCYFSLSPEGVQHSTCTARSLCSHWGTLHVRPCIEGLSTRKVRFTATTHFEITVRTNCNLQSRWWMLVYVCMYGAEPALLHLYLTFCPAMLSFCWSLCSHSSPSLRCLYIVTKNQLITSSLQSLWVKHTACFLSLCKYNDAKIYICRIL